MGWRLLILGYLNDGLVGVKDDRFPILFRDGGDD